MNRRAFLLAAAASAAGDLPPVRAITRGPKFHWFGYYDKLQFDPASRYALGVEGTFEHRLPAAADSLRIGMVDLADGDRWIDLGETRSWSWHQTCMLQWLPGSKTEVIYNDRADGKFVSHILNVRSGKRRTLPAPVYALSPDARWAVLTDFRRLYDVRPETGYAGVADPYRESAAPDATGIWRMNLASGKTELLLSYARIAAFEPQQRMTGAKHWFNHLLYSPSGKRFVFLHRWRTPADGRGFATRMFTAASDGTDLRMLDSSGRVSHFIWQDERRLVVWTRREPLGERFYTITDAPGAPAEPFFPDEITRNGHNTFLPGGRWFLSDTSPDKERLQHPYLFDMWSRRSYPLGHFHSPVEYTGYWRCDTTPRHSPDRRKVIVDSPHGGNGRQMYLIDVSGIVAA
jgi:hypothetical protein